MRHNFGHSSQYILIFPQQAKPEDDETTMRKEPLAEVDKQLRFQCVNLQMAYNKCFVTSVFKSLQMQYSFHSHDVQTAVDYCEETPNEIYFTDFLFKVFTKESARIILLDYRMNIPPKLLKRLWMSK